MPITHDDGSAVGGDNARLLHTTRVRTLNDAARSAMCFDFLYVTTGLRSLGVEVAAEALAQVRNLSAFEAGNDPWAEHDFGSLTIRGELVFWKIDYYDKRLEQGSPDPADESVTARVLTVMLASEY